MSNKTSDENVANIEDVKVLKDLMEELKLEKQTDLDNNEYGEYITECDVLDLYDKQILALQHILAELEQKDKRIQELEEENSKTQIMSPYYVKENYIPKQVIIDKIEELKNNLKYIDCNRDCSKCFNKEGKALYRGSDFDFCFAYYQIKGLQELLEGEK